MRLEAILREARVGLASASSRVAAVLGIGLVLVLATAGLDRLATAQSVDRALEFRASGGAVQVVSAPGAIDGRRCEGLSRLDGVAAAGALSAVDGRRASAVVLPGAPFALPRVTPGFVSVLGGDRVSDAGVLLSAELGSAAGLGPADVLHLATGASTDIAGVVELPAAAHRAGLGYAALDQVPASGHFDECWVEVWPPAPDRRPLLFLAVAEGVEAEAPVIEQLAGRLGDGRELASGHEQRVTRYSGQILLGGSLVLGYASVRRRRMELASALHAGVAPVDLLAIVLTETVIWASVVGLLSVAFSTAVMASVDRAAYGLSDGLADAGVLLAGVIVGAAIGCASVRERDFARYSKDR